MRERGRLAPFLFAKSVGVLPPAIFRNVLEELELSCLLAAAAAVVLGDEGDFCTFYRCSDACLLECGHMDKNIFAAVIRCNEAKPAVMVEKLDGAILTHGDAFPYVCARIRFRRTEPRNEKSIRNGKLGNSERCANAAEVSLTGSSVMSRTTQLALIRQM